MCKRRRSALRSLLYPSVLVSEALEAKSVHVPDLSLTILLPVELPEDHSISSYCAQVVSEKVQELDNQNYVIQLPSDIIDIQKCLIGGDKVLIIIPVDMLIKERRFEKLAPWLGYGSRAVTALAFSFLTMLALTLSEQGPFIAYTGAILGLIMTMVIYSFSRAPKDLSRAFRRLDDACFRKKLPSSRETHACDCRDYKKIILALIPLLAIAIAIGDVLCTAYVRYQSVFSLAKDAEDKNELPSWITPGVIAFFAIVLGLAHATTDIIFESSFAYSGGSKVASFCARRRSLTEDSSARGSDRSPLVRSPLSVQR